MAAPRALRRCLPLLRRSCPRLRPPTRAFLRARPVAASAGRRTSTDHTAGNGRYPVPSEEEEEDEEFVGDSEVEELFQQRGAAGVGQGQQRLVIVHPDVKWGSRKQHLTTGESSRQVCPGMHAGGCSATSLLLSAAELMLAEAVGLVNTLDNWTVVDTVVLSTKTPEKKRIFGKGNFQSLTGTVCGPVPTALRPPSQSLSQILRFPPQRKFAKRQESPPCL